MSDPTQSYVYGTNGIVIGVTFAGLFLVIAAVGFFLYYHRHRKPTGARDGLLNTRPASPYRKSSQRLFGKSKEKAHVLPIANPNSEHSGLTGSHRSGASVSAPYYTDFAPDALHIPSTITEKDEVRSASEISPQPASTGDTALSLPSPPAPVHPS